jgi:carbon monoxide dehydrogenase subunit G
VATLCQEISIETAPEKAWDALRDVGALHQRLVPGFVIDTVMEGSTRIVTFGNGTIAREEIVSIDDARRRVAWAIVGAQFRHFNGAAQIETDAKGGTRFVWTTDVLPDDFAPRVEAMMSAGLQAAKQALERSGSG